ncbi:MAG: O-antigen ligase family protein [Verrucomicrobiales bacterium]|jgi:O-antigen ligase|nr:O-antigen ligase family protein [Verrucomicrobiales bacterium]
MNVNDPAANREKHDDVSRPTKFISAAVLSLCAVLVAVTSLHWGGMIPNVAVWLFPAGALLWLLVLLGAARNIQRGIATGGWPEVFVLLWLVYAMFSWFQSPAEYVARWEWLWILVYAAVFLSLRNFVHSPRWYFWLVAWLVGCATVICLFGFMHREGVYNIWGLPRPDYGPRISGTFGCPNHFGDFLVMGGLAALGLGFYNRLKWPVRLVCFYLFMMFTAGIFYSVSRGSFLGWTAGIIAVTVFLFIDRRTSLKLKLVFLAAILLGVGYCVFVVSNDEFALSRVEQAMRGDIRLLLAQDALRIWDGHKLFGSGMATFDFWHQRLHQEGFFGRAIYTHNDYLNLLSDYGIIGAVIVSGFLAALVARLWARTRRELVPPEQQIATRLAWCVLAAVAAHETFDFNLHIPACAIACFSLLAIGSAQIKHRPATSLVTHSGSIALIISALVAVFFLATLTTRTGQSLQFFKQSNGSLPTRSPEQVAKEVEKLRQIDPTNAEALESAGDILRIKAANLNPAINAANDASDSVTATRLMEERETLGQQALRYYSLAQTANQLSDIPLLKQALTLDALQRYGEAQLFYAKALANQPHNSFFRYYYGFHLAVMGEYDLARKEFRAALSAPVIRNTDKTLRSLAEQALEELNALDRRAPF